MSTRRPWQLTAASFLLVALGAYGQGNEDDLTSLSYISYLERYATVKAAAQGETLDAVVNMPVLPGDRVETARGARMEIQLADGSTVWLDQFTTLDFDSIANTRGYTAPRTALYLAAGGVAVEVGPQAASVLVNSPAGSVYLARGGLYLLELEGNQLRVAAHRGSAELPAGMGSVLLRTGFAAWLAEGEEVQRVEWSGDGNDFWRWVLERRLPPAQAPSARYVEGAPRAYVLDSYGEWVYVGDLGAWGWRPRVSVTWVPYSYGRWYWTPAGWYWISYEPWGWYPYHYGSWYFSVSFGWVWFWDPVWAPAWVHWIYTPGYVGWCPRGYYDWWWWHHHHRDHRPRRWSEVSFDFSGRVRLGHIDHRPWTFVPEDRFSYSHIERVRVDAQRIVHSLGDREAIVRSGPLVGPPPREQGRPHAFRDLFQEQPGREVTPFLRREAGAPREVQELPPLTRTSEAVRAARPIAVPLPGRENEARPDGFGAPLEGERPGNWERSRPSWREQQREGIPERPSAPGTPGRPDIAPRQPSSWKPRLPRADAPENPRVYERREGSEPRTDPGAPRPVHRWQPGTDSFPERSVPPPANPEPRRFVPRESPRLREVPVQPAPRIRAPGAPSVPPSGSSPGVGAPRGSTSLRPEAPPRSSTGGSSRGSAGSGSPSRPAHDRPRH